MAYERNNFRDRDDRWRDRDRDFGRGSQRDYYGRDGDRGFLDRAGDEVRSWFGDDEAERRREADARRYEAERGYGNRTDYGRDRYTGDYGRNTAGGWGNQRGWNDDRFSSSFGAPSSGFEGDTDRARRFDRIDPGSVGSAGQQISPAGTAYGAGYGIGAYGGYQSSSERFSPASSSYGARGSDLHDRHYSEWRNQQIDNLDRDYDDYRREHQSKFEQEFGSWRDKRQGQRQHLGKATEHMEVVGSDGQHVGKVDHVRQDRIILAKNDEAAGGRHHSIPCSWIDSVDDKVTINKTAEEATRAWKDEERSRALFERDDQGSDGPHTLNRSFSGTYGNR